MRNILDILFQNLPDSVSTVVITLFGFPIMISGVKLISFSLPDNLMKYKSLFFVVILGMIFSIIFAFFSYYVPKFVRTKTSIFTFILWLFMCVSFSFASYKFIDKVCYGLGSASAVGILFILVVYFFQTEIWSQLQTPSSENVNIVGLELLIRFLLFFLMLFCVITIFTVPIVSFVNTDISKAFITITILHTASFLIWFFITAIVATNEGRN